MARATPSPSRALFPSRSPLHIHGTLLSQASSLGDMDADAIDEQLRQLVKQRYGSAEKFFNSTTSEVGISRKEWKAALHRLGMRLPTIQLEHV